MFLRSADCKSRNNRPGHWKFACTTLALILAICSSPAIYRLCADTVPSVENVVLSDGWNLRSDGWRSNDFGDVVFKRGGDYDPGSSIVLLTSAGSTRIASVDDLVPGRADLAFVDFNSLVPNYLGLGKDLALNNRGEVAFVAAVAQASNPSCEGLFIYSGGRISTVALESDPAPRSNGRSFGIFGRIWLNNTGEIAFVAETGLYLFSNGVIDKILLTGETTPSGNQVVFLLDWMSHNDLFISDDGVVTFGTSEPRVDNLYPGGSPNQIRSQAIPVAPGGGSYSNMSDTAASRLGEIAFRIWFGSDPDKQGLFLLRKDGNATRILEPVDPYYSGGGIFRYQNGSLTELVAQGNPAPGGGSFYKIFDISVSRRGEVAFRAWVGSDPDKQGLFFLRKDGNVTRILTHGDPKPAGGYFNLYHYVYNFGARIISHRVGPAVNELGEVAFIESGIYIYRDSKIQKIAEPQDRVPGSSGVTYSDSFYTLQVNNRGLVVFGADTSRGRGIFLFTGSDILKLALQLDEIPGTGSETYAGVGLAQIASNSANVTFHSALCCGSWTEGIFLANGFPIFIPGGDFEQGASNGYPVGWQTVWSTSGSGEASLYNSDGTDAFRGNSVLRLHVNSGGDSVFALSDPIQVSADTDYSITSQLRYNLNSPSDAVWFTVIQSDGAGNTVGMDEARGIRGESLWRWIPKRLIIHTSSNAAFIRIRLGLVADSESYLDIDSVR